MDELVNALHNIERHIAPSGVELRLESECLRVTSGDLIRSLPLTRLYRPSAEDVRAGAAPERVLVLASPSAKAREAAAPFNHIVVPAGNFRLVLPGVALWRETAPPPPRPTQTRVRLQGRTGVVAETLLLGGKRAWSLHELARLSGVSPSLVHRVLERLEHEQCLNVQGGGPDKTRTLTHPDGLAQIWSQEERAPQVVLRGYLYGATPEAIAHKASQVCPEGAVGGLWAANDYCPILTRVPLPLRFWVPEGFWLERFAEAGMEATNEGANIEIVQSKGDPWRHHRRAELRGAGSLTAVSPWRAWREVSQATGRGQELAEALSKQLHTQFEAEFSLLKESDNPISAKEESLWK